MPYEVQPLHKLRYWTLEMNKVALSFYFLAKLLERKVPGIHLACSGDCPSSHTVLSDLSSSLFLT